MGSLFPLSYSFTTQIGSYVNGIWTVGTNTVSTFLGSCQPITGKELETLAIGRKDLGKIKIYTDSDLPVSIEGGTDSGAIVTYNGQTWEVISKMTYISGLIEHKKYVAELRNA